MQFERKKREIFITGAGVSAESGIPTFRGKDGFWTIGSSNYTPQQMATRTMFLSRPDEFLLWYFRRFATYRNLNPNSVHEWLANKPLITQNIDTLDFKAGNKEYIPIHGRLDKVSKFSEENEPLGNLTEAPWQTINGELSEQKLKLQLLDAFKISNTTKIPEFGVSLKPFVLLFDEYYTESYRISEAIKKMSEATQFVFLGTSFSVGFTQIALDIAKQNEARVIIVDPEPKNINYKNTEYHEITANEYINLQENK
ncbi:sirtuin [Pseudomonadota bacterium]|nr:sirtuin [Pseudomonadota bacterium]